MFSTPLTCCSMGVVTVCSTTSALAPGYVASTTTCGGVISGNIAIGRNGIATAPATTMTMASTEAKMGRSMKKLTNTASAPGGWRKRLHRGLHAHPGPDLLETLDHHVLAGLHAVLDDPQRPYTCAHPNGAHLHGPVRCDHEQRRGALAFLDRGLRHDERVGELREEGAKPHVLARLEQPRRIRKDGTK